MNLRRLFMGIVVLLIGSVSVKAQRTISGVVTDSANQAPLPSVTILIKGSKKGTQTTQDGKFTLSVPANATKLVVSSVGYGTKEVSISENLSISLSVSNTSLNEVVVIGYGTTRKKDLTGSIATVNEKDFQKGNIVTPEQLIAGKVAGVQIVSNGGAPGAGSTIRIRGGASLNASNDPLIVIDGVPLSNNAISGSPNPLSLINPNDIASMNILKDASATAIYGSRASNGVIIITTKKGRSGKPQFTFGSQLTLSTPVKEVDVLSAAEFRNVIDSNGTATQKSLLGDANTDWQKQIYQNALAEDNNLSVSGALKNMPYRVSVGFLNQDGILKTGNLKRTSAGINLSPSLFNNHLKIDINFKGAESKSRFANQDAIGSAIIFDPTKPVYSGDKRFGGYYEWLDPSTGLPNTLSARNPVGLLNEKDDKSTVYRSIGNVQLDYKLHFFPDLHAIVNLGYDASKGTGTVFIPDSAASNYVSKGQNNHYKQTTTNTVLEAYFSYNKDIVSINSHVDAVAGYSYNDFLTTNYNYANFNAYGDTIANSQPNFAFDKPRYTLISFYGRLNYNYKEKYFITGSLRDDGSSKFAPENRWGLFPAAAFAWRIKNENFLKNSRLFSDLKLRLGYGKTGQQEGIDYYSYISFYNLSNSTAEYQLGDNYYQMYRPGGYYLQRTWEKTATYNVGLDYGFLNNRINGSVDVYYKKTTDLLNQIDQPAGTNFSNKIVANVGSMENRGVEFNLNVTPIKSAVVWNVNFNVTYNKNKITNLTIAPDPSFPGNQIGTFNGGTGNTIQINAVGYNRASFYVYQQVYDDAGKPIEGLFADRNRDGIINENDLYEFKNPDPRFFYGLSSDVSWKNWSAGFTARASYGNYIYNNVYSNLGRLSTVTGVTAILNNASVNYLETGFSGTAIRELQSDYYIQNASFIRMDNIYIGFNAGNVFGANTNLRISAGVQNAFTITKYDGIDPEVSSGIDYNFYPRPRNYVLGATLGF